MNKSHLRTRLYSVALAVAASASLSACTSLGYRCPLDPNEKPESATACASMQESMDGAKHGAGGKISVLLDDKGRLVSPAMQQNKPAVPLAGAMPGAPEPYRNSSGEPVFEQPHVYQAWVPAFVDAEGNLHDGHHTWFSTPGRWSYGTTRDYSANSGGEALMRPAMPGDRPAGKIVQTDGKAPAQAQAKKDAKQAAQLSAQDKDKAALSNLSAAASSMGKPQPTNAQPGAGGQAPLPGSAATPAPTGTVTAPAINLAD
ncbi:DNA mismatch repair protein MutL [Novimethylophilus kurashikiensis]|uniref:DNA mismatch repair protein MutL n=1 Tax=Novimethylophilus kurashikiensis TaxID=1825523 RepID=A0A2R5F841_9PROT|nr:hypothetical protein [Novimethylophilus kurashikiensis]GBG14412.1 DNA mismatch repair protein MutL [Novimethylophilus kurashikiensis]